MTINPTEISDIIKDKINKLDTKTQSHNQGTVISLTDGIARIYGITDALQGEMLEFPNNIFGAFVENNMLGIVFISILFGIALNLTDDLTDKLSNNFERLNIVFMKIVLIIMSFAPIGVFCLMGSYVMDHGLNIFGDLIQYVLILIFVLFFFTPS